MQFNRYQIAFLTLIGASLLLQIIAAILYVSGEDKPLVIDGVPLVAEGSPGSDVVLEVLISNRGKHTVRILGASTAQSCLSSGCAKEAPDLPMKIKGHESRTTQIAYRIGWQDEPPYVLTFYTDCVSQPQLNVTIRNRYIEQ